MLFGYLCDRVSYVGVIIFSGLGSSILAFVLWGFAHNLTLVYVFVVLLGSVVSLSCYPYFPGILTRLFRVVVLLQLYLPLVPSYQVSIPILCYRVGLTFYLSGSQPTTPFMALTALRGIGAIIGPLISAALHPSRVEMGLPSSSGWGGYGFTGALGHRITLESR